MANHRNLPCTTYEYCRGNVVQGTILMTLSDQWSGYAQQICKSSLMMSEQRSCTEVVVQRSCTEVVVHGYCIWKQMMGHARSIGSTATMDSLLVPGLQPRAVCVTIGIYTYKLSAKTA